MFIQVGISIKIMMMTKMTLIVVMKRFMVVNDYIDHDVDDGDNDDEDGEDDDDDENDDDYKGRTRIGDINLGRGFYRAEKKNLVSLNFL